MTTGFLTPEKAECMRGEKSKKSCSVCGKEMHPKSLARHCRVAHGVETASMATCFDEEDGLFLVRNSSHGGVGYPIHVKKVMGSEHGVQCEVRDCMDFMRVAWKSGMKTAMCKHLEKVGTNCTFPEEIELSTEALNDLSPSGLSKCSKTIEYKNASHSRHVQQKITHGVWFLYKRVRGFITFLSTTEMFIIIRDFVGLL